MCYKNVVELVHNIANNNPIVLASVVWMSDSYQCLYCNASFNTKHDWLLNLSAICPFGRSSAIQSDNGWLSVRLSQAYHSPSFISSSFTFIVLTCFYSCMWFVCVMFIFLVCSNVNWISSRLIPHLFSLHHERRHEHLRCDVLCLQIQFFLLLLLQWHWSGTWIQCVLSRIYNQHSDEFSDQLLCDLAYRNRNGKRTCGRNLRCQSFRQWDNSVCRNDCGLYHRHL